MTKHLCNSFWVVYVLLLLFWSMNESVALIGQQIIMRKRKIWLEAITLGAPNWKTVEEPGHKWPGRLLAQLLSDPTEADLWVSDWSFQDYGSAGCKKRKCLRMGLVGVESYSTSSWSVCRNLEYWDNIFSKTSTPCRGSKYFRFC